MTQHCDSTCSFCAREFWRWLKRYQKERRGRPGFSDFTAAAATSIKPESPSEAGAYQRWEAGR